jgi:hypothetical protein
VFQAPRGNVAIGVQAEIQIGFCALMWFFFNFAVRIVFHGQTEFLKKQAIGMEKFSAKEIYNDLHEEYDHPSDS